MAKDYYDILGISKAATKDEIKRAYRRLAREHHPDMVKDGDKSTAEKRFKEINEAYQVLSDPQKRKMYDQFGHAGPGSGGTGPGHSGKWSPFTYTYSSSGADPFGSIFEGFDPFDVFESFFGSRGFGRSRAPRKGKNLYYEMHISFKEAVTGIEREIKVDSGKVTIKIPKGIRSGTEIRFSGMGMAGPGSVPKGDLFITVRYKSPTEFDIARENVIVTKEINFVTALLGGVVDVPIVDAASPSGVGSAQLKIPLGTQPVSSFVVKGKGLPRLHRSGNGDVLVQTIVTFPRRLSRKQRKILEQLRDL